MDGALPPPLGDMLTILPKGIVENTAEIYAEVASYPVVPPEKICEYWQVYTTTFRKLVDPTASRLENFWWHVWGSDRRYLSGRTLAKIYEEISTGPTIAPLRCPLNRYEGPPTPRRSQHELDGRREKERKQARGRERQGGEGGKDEGEADASPPPKKERTSSSAKPPPTHSILKKPRGPSASGPRPTARFISPHASEDEAKKDDEGSSGSTAVAGQEMRPRPPPTRSDRKSGTGSAKKFVASSSASKRRPALARRPSSQSSTGSDVTFREAASSSGSRSSATQRGVPPPIAENVARGPVSRSQGSSASSTQGSVPNAKAAGKRSAPRSASDKRAAARGSAAAPIEEERPVVVQAPAAVPQPNPSEPLGPTDTRRNMEAHEATRLRRDSSRGTAQAAGSVAPPAVVAAAASGLTAASRMARSQSQAEQLQRHRDLSLGRPPPQGLVASSIAATSQVAAQGQFDSENSGPAAIFAAAAAGDPAALSHAGTPSGLTSRPSSSSLLDPRFTPTQPNPAPAVPFGRSKSQLTLLLEREKARMGDLKPKTADERLEDGDET